MTALFPELLALIIQACTISSTQSYADITLEAQRRCQASLVSCIHRSPGKRSSLYLAFTECLADKSIK